MQGGGVFGMAYARKPARPVSRWLPGGGVLGCPG